MNLTETLTDLLFPAPLATYTETTPGFVNVGKNRKVAAFVLNLEQAQHVMVYCPGNGEDAHDVAELMRELLPAGWGMVIPAYAGYGLSDGGRSEEGCLSAARDAYDWLVGSKEFPSWKIVIAGFSLGTGVAIQLAAQRKCKGVVLFAPFLNGRSLIEHWVGKDAAKEMLRQARPFISDRIISTLKKPVIVIHGNQDEVIPKDSGWKLFLRAKEPLAYHTLNAGHNNLIPRFGTYGLMKVFDQIESYSEPSHIAGELALLETIQWKPVRALREIARKLAIKDGSVMRQGALITAICRKALSLDFESLVKHDFITMGEDAFSALVMTIRAGAAEVDDKDVVAYFENSCFVDVRKNRYGGYTVRLPCEIRKELSARYEKWHCERITIEQYVFSAVALYGIVTFDDLFEFMRREDRSEMQHLTDWYLRSVVENRRGERDVYFVRGDCICGSEFDVGEKTDEAIAEFLRRRNRINRWEPTGVNEFPLSGSGFYYLLSPHAKALDAWLESHGMGDDCDRKAWMVYVTLRFQTGERLYDIAKKLLSECSPNSDESGMNGLCVAITEFVDNMRLKINNGWTIKELSESNIEGYNLDVPVRLEDLRCYDSINRTAHDLRRPRGWV